MEEVELRSKGTNHQNIIYRDTNISWRGDALHRHDISKIARIMIPPKGQKQKF